MIGHELGRRDCDVITTRGVILVSRSYKHSPWSKDGSPGWRRFAKRLANRTVRKARDVPNGGAYRKVFQSYDIYDYISYCPKYSHYYWKDIDGWYKYYYRK